MANFIIQLLIAFSRVIRSLFGIAGVCRYTITCSAYARYALTQYPAHKALYTIVKRFLSCSFLFIPYKQS